VFCPFSPPLDVFRSGSLPERIVRAGRERHDGWWRARRIREEARQALGGLGQVALVDDVPSRR